MTKINGIKNLLFDLGGVIMDIKRERCVEALTELGMTDADSMLGLYVQAGPFLLLEEGKMSATEFRDEMRKHFTHDVTDAEIDAAFCKFLLGIPVHRLESLRALRERYHIYLLSNTNPIMYDSDIAMYFRAEGREMSDYFDGQVVSYEALCAKPDPEIFHYTINKLGIRAEETLFLDDSQKNLDSAATLGFHTALVAPGTEFAQVINQLEKE